MDPHNVDARGPVVEDDSPEGQLHELARLVGGLLAREHLRRRAAVEPGERQKDERPDAGQDTV